MKLEVEVDIECPNCKNKLKTRLDSMRPGQKKRCTKCRSEISFTGDDGRKAQRAIDDFAKSIKKMFK